MADASPVVVRPLAEADLADADRVFRVAFGTFLGAADPGQFFGDAEFVRTRWHAGNDAAFAAVREGRWLPWEPGHAAMPHEEDHDPRGDE